MGSIYFITFDGSLSGRRYVGSARAIKSRIRCHLYLLRRGRHHSILLQRAFNKYGEDTFRVGILENVSDDSHLIEREQHWIDAFSGRLYNRSLTAASRLGTRMSKESRQKISARLIGNSYRKGIPHDDEARAKISEGVKLAYLSGRTRKPSGNASAFNKFLEDVRSGKRKHPKSLDDTRIVAILTTLYETNSMIETAAAFGVCRGSVWHTAKQFRKLLDQSIEAATGMRNTKKYRSTAIHPDWFSLVL